MKYVELPDVTIKLLDVTKKFVLFSKTSTEYNFFIIEMNSFRKNITFLSLYAYFIT